MPKTEPGAVPAEVRRVVERFERWRAVKQARERIPPNLWRAAAKLCKTNGVRRTGRWLRLNYTDLQHHAGRRLRSRRPKPAFVELSLPAAVAAEASTAQYVVELAGQGDGVPRIHVRGASASEVAALARALSAAGGGS